MLKPFELNVYPPLSDDVQQHVARNLENGDRPFLYLDMEHVPGSLLSRHKRLTNAELAAELWASLAMAYAQREIGNEHHSEREEQRSKTLRRFATLPHASDVPE